MMSADIKYSNKDMSEDVERESVTKDEHPKKVEKDQEIDQLLTDSGIGALAKSAAATTKKFKVFWVLLFFIALIGFTSNLYHIILRFLQVPVLTQMNQEFDQFIWPHITVCNPSNPIPFWKSSDLEGKWNDLLKKADEIPRMIYRGGKDVTIAKPYLLMSSVTPHDFYNDTVSAVFLSIQVLFQQKTIATSAGSFDKFTSVKNFKLAIDNRLGSSRYPIPCLTLKPDVIASLVGKDQSNILSIKFNLIEDYASYMRFNSGFETRKTYMYLSGPNQTLKSSVLYFLYPGTTSTFVATEKRYRRIRDCKDEHFEVELYDSTMANSRNYSGGFETCREYVSQQKFFERCDCYNPFLPIYKISSGLPRLCLNISLFNKDEVEKNVECLNKVNDEYSKGDKFEKILSSVCDKYRKAQCHQTNYRYLRHSSAWTTDMSESRRKMMAGAVRALPNGPKNGKVPPNFINRNLMIVTLSRAPGLVSATLEEYEYPASQLLSDIGGTMGLWLGISVISLFEIMQFVILLTHVFIKRRRANS